MNLHVKPFDLREMMTLTSELASEVGRLFDKGDQVNREEARQVFASLRKELDSGRVRAAEPDAESPTGWRVNTWVKQGILVGFRVGEIVDASVNRDRLPFYDKDTLPVKRLDVTSGVRLVPGGSTIRAGAYVAPGVICMPPMYINAGAYVDDGSMVDSHALVGSCAQIGSNCHISGGAGIGGVLEPLQAGPVIIEDDVFIGARSEVAEGVIVERGSVLSMGVYIGASTKIIDRSTGEIHRGHVPSYSVVVSGTMPGKTLPDGSPGPGLYCAVIVKRVDERTRSKTSVNELLRD